jgi:hypothetical protein
VTSALQLALAKVFDCTSAWIQIRKVSLPADTSASWITKAMIGSKPDMSVEFHLMLPPLASAADFDWKHRLNGLSYAQATAIFNSAVNEVANLLVNDGSVHVVRKSTINNEGGSKIVILICAIVGGIVFLSCLGLLIAHLKGLTATWRLRLKPIEVPGDLEKQQAVFAKEHKKPSKAGKEQSILGWSSPCVVVPIVVDDASARTLEDLGAPDPEDGDVYRWTQQSTNNMPESLQKELGHPAAGNVVTCMQKELMQERGLDLEAAVAQGMFTHEEPWAVFLMQGADILTEPRLGADSDGHMECFEKFLVSEQSQCLSSGAAFLKLSNGRGWVEKRRCKEAGVVRTPEVYDNAIACEFTAAVGREDSNELLIDQM